MENMVQTSSSPSHPSNASNLAQSAATEADQSSNWTRRSLLASIGALGAVAAVPSAAWAASAGRSKGPAVASRVGTTSGAIPAEIPTALAAAEGSAADTVTFPTARVTATAVKLTNGPAPAAPAGGKPFEVTFQGHTIRGFDIPGKGPAIVLTHGFPDNLHLYDNLYPLLAGRQRVIAFDFIGWGISDKPLPGAFEYTMNANRLQIEAVLDALKPGPVTLVLHDASGIPGIDLAIDQPARVRKLVLLNTFYGLMPTQSAPVAIAIYSDASMQVIEDATNLSPAAIEALYRSQVGSFIVDKDLKTTFTNRLWSQFGEALPAFVALNDVLFNEVRDRTIGPRKLSQLTVPTRILFGARDVNLTPAAGEEFKRQIKGSRLTIVNEAGHFPQIDVPKQVAKVVLG
jgi:haloalkane dehalogenase